MFRLEQHKAYQVAFECVCVNRTQTIASDYSSASLQASWSVIDILLIVHVSSRDRSDCRPMVQLKLQLPFPVNISNVFTLII